MMLSRRYIAAALLRVAVAVAIVGGGALVPSAAAAQSDMERAKKAFREGKRLYEQNEYEEAARAFKKAYQLSDRGELLYNIGQAYRKAGKLEKAESYFQRYLKEKPDAPNSEEVVQKVVEIQGKLAAEMASIRVETGDEGRSVRVGDEEETRCTTPCSVSVDGGKHVLHVTGEGMQTVTRTVSIEKGGEKTVKIDLSKKGVSGQLLVRTDRGGGALRVEGVGESSLPMSKPLRLEAGTYDLRITGPSGEVWTGDVDIEGGETSELLVSTATPAKRSPDVRRSVAYGLAGASVALIAGGLLLGQNAKQTHEILNTQQQNAGRVDPELLSKGRREQTAANILLGAGAATLLTGAGLFTWDLLGSNERPRDRSASAAR